MLPSMGGRVERYFIPAVIGFAPFVLLLMTWQAERMSRLMLVMRVYSAPEIAAELFTILVALREGLLAAWKPPRRGSLGFAALIALGLLVAIALADAIFVAPTTSAAVERTGFWLVHLLFGLSVAFLCGRLFAARDLVGGYLAGFAVFALAFAIFAAGALQRPVDWTWDLPAVVHIRHLGIYATAAIGLAIGVMATARRRAIWLAAFAVALAGFALTLWTGSRGPIAALAAAVIAGAIIAPSMRRARAWGGALLSLALAIPAIAWLPVPAANMGAGRTVAATVQVADAGTGRGALWRLVIEAIERRPLFGYGEGQMPTVATFYGMAQPHNIVLQLLLAWGVAGLTCAAVLAYWFLRRAIPAVRRDEPALLPPLMAMLSLFALSMVDAALYHILPLSIFAACAGMIAAGWRSESSRR